VCNIPNRHAKAAEFWSIDRLPGRTSARMGRPDGWNVRMDGTPRRMEPAAGVADPHVHPLEPLAVRLTLSKTFEGEILGRPQ
jgi:hypothetical protein